MAEIAWKKHSKDPRLSYAGFEGGLARLQDGGWHWWVRTSLRRYAGQSCSETAAKASVSLVIRCIETGMDPAFYLRSV